MALYDLPTTLTTLYINIKLTDKLVKKLTVLTQIYVAHLILSSRKLD